VVKVGIVGHGGREHALGHSVAQDPEVSEVFYIPGNGGTEEGKGRNVAIDATDPKNWGEVADLVERESLDALIVGPEKHLHLGFTNFFTSLGYNLVFGTDKIGSQLEADKFFSYQVMEVLGIPQAKGRKCTTIGQSESAIKRFYDEGKDAVIKARGLTEGKGVSVCSSLEEALAEIKIHASKYGPEALIAERLHGQEFSVFGICDGENVLPLEISLQDHKRLYEDNHKGFNPNTGGMGAYGPVPIAPAEVVREVAESIMKPVVRYMGENGHPYKGFLYAGMIMTEQGPKVLEFNVRFGDPECQPAMMMLENGIYRPILLALEGKLNEAQIEFRPGAACCVVLSSKGYPDSNSYKDRLRLEISGIDEANSISGVKVFHAGTKRENGKILTSGGRVLGVTAYSSAGIAGVQALAYEGVERIKVNGGFHFRKDIASKALGK